MHRRLRYRPALIAVTIASLAGGAWWTPSASAAPAAPAGLTLTEASEIRGRAEEKLGRLEAEKLVLDARRAATSLDAEAIAEDLASARESMRDRAVAAYVGDATDLALSAIFDAGTATDAADRRVLLVSRFGVAADDVDRYRRMKEDTDPALVELALAIDDLDSRIAAATDAVVQARAVEGDLERAEERARREAAAEAEAEAETPQPAATPTTASTRVTVAVRPPTPTPAAAAPPPAPTEPPAPLPAPPPGGPTEAQWAALRRCESGGNYQIVSANGRYRGAYQFDLQTWASVGGSGDPAAASPAEQDLRAKILYSRRGARAWPTCGIHLR